MYLRVCFVCHFHCVLLHSSRYVDVKISGILWYKERINLKQPESCFKTFYATDHMPLHFRKKALSDFRQNSSLWTESLTKIGSFSHGGFWTISSSLLKKTQLSHNSPLCNLELPSQYFCATWDHITMTHSTGCWTEYHTTLVIIH